VNHIKEARRRERAALRRLVDRVKGAPPSVRTRKATGKELRTIGRRCEHCKLPILRDDECYPDRQGRPIHTADYCQRARARARAQAQNQAA
jgi:hypothetical protein